MALNMSSSLPPSTAELLPVSGDFVRCYEREANASLSGLALGDVTVRRVADWAPFLECLLGPKRPPTAVVVPITVLYGLLFLTGVFGNACTMLVIVKNKFMHTATNFYLFNLAFADLLSLVIGMPLELYGYMWHQYPWELGGVMCRLRAVLAEAPAYASILTIVAFTIERFMAICQPMNIKTENREKLLRAAWVIGLVWILSLGASAPVAFFHAINTIKDYEGNPIQESAWCNLAYDRPSQTWPSLFLTLTLVFFAVPITVLSVLYGVIGYVLYKSCQPLGQTVTYWHVPRSAAASTVAGGTTHQVCFNDAEEAPRPPPPTLPGDDRLRKQIEVQRVRMLRRKSVIKMLVAVVIAFFICWAPFHAQRLLFVYVSISAEWTEQLRIANEVVSYLSGVLYFFNATLNPVLYNVMSKRFRTAFKATVWQFLSCRNCVLRGLWYCGACAFDICTCACIREVIHGFNPSSSYPEEDGHVGMDAECEQPRRKRSCASAEALGVVDCWQQCSSRSSGNKRSNVSSTNNTKGNNPAQQTKRSLLTATGPSEKLHQLRHHQQQEKQQQTMIPMSANNNKPATMLGKRNSSSSSGFSSRTLLQRTFPTVAYAKEGIHRSDRHRRFRSGLSPNFSTHRDASHHHRRSHYNNRRLGSGNSRGRHRPAKSEGDDPDLVVDWSLLSRPQPQQQQQQQCSVSSPMLPAPGRARGPMLLEETGSKRVYRFQARSTFAVGETQIGASSSLLEMKAYYSDAQLNGRRPSPCFVDSFFTN